MCLRQPGRRREFLPPPKDTQSDLGITAPEIDHMYIGKKFYRTLQDVDVRGDADVALDHHLLVARLKFKMRWNWTEGTKKRLRFNTTLLKDTNKRSVVNIALSNKFQVPQELLEGEM